MPQIILDLDGTLFDNVPRTKRILLDQARRIFGDEADVSKVIGDMPYRELTGGWARVALHRAVANCRLALEGGQPRHLVTEDERFA